MNQLAFGQPEKNPNPGCAELMAMAERELSAFFKAVTDLFGSEQAEHSAEDWLRELEATNCLPASTHEWRLITTRVSTRRVNALSLSTKFTNA